MGARGPKQEAPELSALKGHPSNRSKDRVSAPKTDLAPVGWAPPGHLRGEAKREWKRLVGPLCRIGLLTIADRDVFATYCVLHGRHVEAEYMIGREGSLTKTPNGHKQPSPWITISRDAMQLKLRYLAAVGITPADRARVMAGTPPLDDTPEAEKPPTKAPQTREEIPDEELFGKKPH